MFKGEVTCTASFKTGKRKGEVCGAKAYYVVDNSPICGVHSKKLQREELQENPNKKENQAIENARHAESCNLETKKNESRNKRGDVVCAQLRMMKLPAHVDGYYSIFPNYKSGSRKDGLGFPELSPMSLGPVKTEQPHVPVFSCLENFWQQSKKYSDETMEAFISNQEEWASKPPCRHKRKGVPVEGWVYQKEDGERVLLSYLEARPYYCTIYEKLARTTSSFRRLESMLEKGMNLQIFGYDGRDFSSYLGETLKEKLKNCYLDGKKPFGHELCLVAMLLLKTEDLPWNYGEYSL